MNLISGRSLYGRWIAAGRGVRAAALIIDYPLMPNQFSMRLYDSAGQKTKEISSDMQNSPLSSIEFEITANGCGELKITTDRNNRLPEGYNQRVDISLFGDGQPWYSGYIQRVPQVGSTEELAQYSGYGFFNQLDKVIVARTYENQDIAAIVDHITRTDIESKTDVLYNAGKIYSTGYTAEKLAFDYVKAKEAIKTLAEFATDYIYGVDEYRQLFFKPLTTGINENSRFWVGHHVHDFKPEEDVDDIINFFYVKGGKMTGGENVYKSGGVPVAFSDATSIATYGRREDILSVPSAIANADIERWAQSQLLISKDPKRTAKVSGFTPEIAYRKIKPEGLARITTAESLTYDYPIKSVKYKIDPNGVQFSMQMGDYERRLDRYIAQLYRNAKNAEFAQALNNKQLSGGTI
jgi:hypothetical protein